MEFSQHNMTDLFKGFSTLVNRGLGTVYTGWKDWANEVKSGTLIQSYPQMILNGSMREWIGDRVINHVGAQKMDVMNRDFENTVCVERNAIKDDEYGVYGPMFEALGTNAGNLWGQLAADALCSPGNWMDGAAFYGEREFGESVINNSMGAVELTIANYEAARARMMGFCGADGKPLLLIPDTLVCGPLLEGKAKTIFNAETVAVDGVQVSNIHKGECRIDMCPWLVGDRAKYWFLVCTTRGVKPFILQKREENPLQRLDQEDDENVFYRRECIYGLHYRGASAAVIPQLVIGAFPPNS